VRGPINKTVVVIKRNLREYFQIMVLAVASILPMFISGGFVSAADLTDRKATISTSRPSSTDVEFIFNYNMPNTTSTKAGIIYQFCTTPLGTCTASGWTLTGFTHDSQSGWASNATAFAAHAAVDENNCSQSTNATSMICFERDETVATGTGGGAVVHTISGINTNATIQTVYIRISIYSDDDFQTVDLLDSGVVAVAIVRQLTVSGRVQERLAFCVFAIDDAAALPTNCAAAPTTTTIDLGVLDNAGIYTSPVDNSPPTSQGNDFYGALQLNTNAQDGTTITYFPETSGSGTNELRSFRIPGSTCDVSGTSLLDPCFVDASGAGETFVAGTERFGMYVACIDTTQGTTTSLGSVSGAYDGSDNTVTSAADCENEAATDFAWNDSTTAVTLTSSTAVVDDEIVKVRFAATAGTTTPTGTYSVITTYIATPQF
jgi:hypothetical protein